MRRLEFASLQVKNLETSKNFYTEKLGFELSEMKNPDAAIFKFNKGETSLPSENHWKNWREKSWAMVCRFGLQLMKK